MPRQPQSKKPIPTGKPLVEIFAGYREHKLLLASKSTVYQYALNLRRFTDFMGREPTADDLNDQNIAACMAWLVKECELSPSTANKLKDDFCAVWRWAARKRLVDHWPDVNDVPDPIRIPIAWTREQLATLWECCMRQPGDFCGVPAGLWWNSLHAVAWDTAERIGALFATEWPQVDLAGGWIVMKAENRKGRREDKLSRLHPTTCTLLRQIVLPERGRVWPWPYHESYLWKRYGEMLRRAHLPNDRSHKFHCLRKSAASYYEACGGDATRLLGHSGREVTQKYLDPTIVQPVHAADLLFRPDEATTGKGGVA